MIVALNNKCNLVNEEYKKYLEDLSKIDSKHSIILCPTFLNVANTNISNVSLGAQNVGSSGKGAYTGEVSAEQLKSYNVDYCIVGHSERRQYQRESNEEVHLKVKQLLDNGIIPILCIGETLEERKNDKVREIIAEEVISAIKELDEESTEKIIIAYEPIWSIGTGIIPSNEEIEEVFKLIKQLLPKNKVLYGGSANDENVDVLKQVSLIDGYLLGGLSLKVEKLNIFLNKLN